MRERYLLELGGENTELGKYEALELFKFKHYNPKIETDYGKIIILSTSKMIENEVISRLAMTRRISHIIFTSEKKNLEDILGDLNEIDIGAKRFAIRQINSKNVDMESTIMIGEKISPKNKIDLDKPEVKVLFYRNDLFYISISQNSWETGYKRCLEHHISNRPYFSPISIHPRIARSMINLSNCDKNETVVDPFCGTGGILIEGADMGLQIVGIDLKEKMIEYTKGNLKHYGFKGQLMNSDFDKISSFPFNSIVCDPPYGIASTSGGENINDLMNRCLDEFQKSMLNKQRLVIAVSNPEFIKNQNLTLLHKFDWYIHKSLTRYVMVLEKN